jgi:hypothetical protein
MPCVNRWSTHPFAETPVSVRVASKSPHPLFGYPEAYFFRRPSAEKAYWVSIAKLTSKQWTACSRPRLCNSLMIPRDVSQSQGRFDTKPSFATEVSKCNGLSACID